MKNSGCLVGKTAIVVGSNPGLGYQTALALALRGCRVILAGVGDLHQNKLKRVNAKTLDLSSLQSVREFASDVIKSEDRLDILIITSGASVESDGATADGLHPVMQANYFGPFLLTHLLADLLKKSAPSRVVFATSFLALFSNLSSENLNCIHLSKALTYCNAKCALSIASGLFSEKLKGSGVTSNCVTGGFAFFEDFTAVYANTLFSFFNDVFCFLCAKDRWKDSRYLVQVATSTKLDRTTGKHFWKSVPFVKPTRTYSRKFCRKIWERTEEFVDLTDKEKLKEKCRRPQK